MSSKTLVTRIKNKYDTSTNWSTNNPILLQGEFSISYDNGIFKIGDGTTHYNDLPSSLTILSYEQMDNIYLNKSTGGTITGPVTIDDEFYNNSATLGNVIVTGSATFNNSTYAIQVPTVDTHVANKKYVDDQITEKLQTSDAMVLKGTLGTGGTITTLPTTDVVQGWTYKVITEGIYAGQQYYEGDMIVAMNSGDITANTTNWLRIPAGSENETTIKLVSGSEVSNLTTEYKFGQLILGTLASYNTISSSSPITITNNNINKTFTISHANSGATAGSYGNAINVNPAYGGTFNVPYITVNATGHITSIENRTITIPASDNTDRYVLQSSNSTSNYRPLLLGYQNSTSISSLGNTVTNQAYTNNTLYVQPSTGTIYSKGLVINKYSSSRTNDFYIRNIIKQLNVNNSGGVGLVSDQDVLSIGTAEQGGIFEIHTWKNSNVNEPELRVYSHFKQEYTHYGDETKKYSQVYTGVRFNNNSITLQMISTPNPSTIEMNHTETYDNSIKISHSKITVKGNDVLINSNSNIEILADYNNYLSYNNDFAIIKGTTYSCPSSRNYVLRASGSGVVLANPKSTGLTNYLRFNENNTILSACRDMFLYSSHIRMNLGGFGANKWSNGANSYEDEGSLRVLGGLGSFINLTIADTNNHTDGTAITSKLHISPDEVRMGINLNGEYTTSGLNSKIVPGSDITNGIVVGKTKTRMYGPIEHRDGTQVFSTSGGTKTSLGWIKLATIYTDDKSHSGNPILYFKLINDRQTYNEPTELFIGFEKRVLNKFEYSGIINSIESNYVFLINPSYGTYDLYVKKVMDADYVTVLEYYNPAAYHGYTIIWHERTLVTTLPTEYKIYPTLISKYNNINAENIETDKATIAGITHNSYQLYNLDNNSFIDFYSHGLELGIRSSSGSISSSWKNRINFDSGITISTINDNIHLNSGNNIELNAVGNVDITTDTSLNVKVSNCAKYFSTNTTNIIAGLSPSAMTTDNLYSTTLNIGDYDFISDTSYQKVTDFYITYGDTTQYGSNLFLSANKEIILLSNDITNIISNDDLYLHSKGSIKEFSNHKINLLSKNDIELIPGAEKNVVYIPSSNNYIRTGNIKGRATMNNDKPTITNFSDIHSQNFEVGATWNIRVDEETGALDFVLV